MRVPEPVNPARPSTARVAFWQALAQALNWLDGKNNPYSPAMCVLALLLVGFFVKLAPALHVVATGK
jgi:hypothetical protein